MNQQAINKMEHFIRNAEGNITHVQRDYHLCRLLAEKENIPYEDDVLAFVCYFHDIAFYRPYAPEGKFDHALESSKLVPSIAQEFGYDDRQIEIIIEAVKYHDKAGMGSHNETRLLRNADGVDYLGYVAVARDFVKFPKDMRKAIEVMKTRVATFGSIIDLPSALELARPRIAELEEFIRRFEEESFGIY